MILESPRILIKVTFLKHFALEVWVSIVRVYISDSRLTVASNVVVPSMAKRLLVNYTPSPWLRLMSTVTIFVILVLCCSALFQLLYCNRLGGRVYESIISVRIETSVMRITDSAAITRLAER